MHKELPSLMVCSVLVHPVRACAKWRASSGVIGELCIFRALFDSHNMQSLLKAQRSLANLRMLVSNERKSGSTLLKLPICFQALDILTVHDAVNVAVANELVLSVHICRSKDERCPTTE